MKAFAQSTDRSGLRQTWQEMLVRDPSQDELSDREMEVAALVAFGMRNREIASQLNIARTTVATHIAHILDKLDFRSRSQIATWITEVRYRGQDG